MTAETPAGPPSAIRKVTAVLEALADHRRSVDIARRTGFSTSTVHRILQELVALGWAREDEERSYSVGPRLLSFAGRAPEEAAIVRAARPALQRLNDSTGLAVHLGCRVGDEVIYIDKIEGRRSYHMRSRIGLVVPLHSTGIGKAMLAYRDDDEVRAIIERSPMVARTVNTITDVEAFLTEMATTRQRGYAVDLEENELHTRCVAAAVIDHRGVPVAGISVSALSFDMDRARMTTLAPLVSGAAGEITETLGGHRPEIPRPPTSSLRRSTRTVPHHAPG